MPTGPEGLSGPLSASTALGDFEPVPTGAHVDHLRDVVAELLQPNHHDPARTPAVRQLDYHAHAARR